MAASPLMQWCGLKYCKHQIRMRAIVVTTDAVVWIEMSTAFSVLMTP